MAVKFEASVVGKCRSEHVWQKLQELPQWGWWNPIVGQSRWLEGKPWEKGSRFFMELARPRRMAMKCEVLEAAPPGKVAWVGKGGGVSGEHWFAFEEQADGTTSIKTWETLTGLATVFLGGGMKAKIQRMHEEWLESMKNEAEKIAREETARGPGGTLPVIQQPK